MPGVFVYSDMVKDNKHFNTYKEGLNLKVLRECCTHCSRILLR